MYRNKQIRNVTVGVVLLFMSVSGFAGIAEFNEAMKKGDYQAAAKEAVAIWETFDKNGKQTAIVAREFGFVNYLARDYDNAEMFATFLVEKGQDLSVPDSQPSTSNVLLKLTQFSAERGDDEREALAAALNNRLKAEGVDQISLIGAETLFRNDWVAGKWALAKDSANLAGQLYARAGAAYIGPLRETALIAAASDFLQAPAHKDYDLIVAAHNQIVNDINNADDAEVQAALMDLKWQAQAWAHTMEAYFHATYSQAGSIISNRLRPQELTALTAGVMPKDTTDSPMPACTGKVDVGSLSYPQRWAEQRLTGTVVLQLDFDENGELSNHKTLAEAPPGLFSDAINESVASFRWQVDPGVDTGTCRMQQHNTIQVIGFWQNCAGLYTQGDCRGSVTEAPPQPGDTSNFN